MKQILTVLTFLFLSAASFAQVPDYLSNNPFDGGFDGSYSFDSDDSFDFNQSGESISVTGKFIQDANSPSSGKLLLEAIVPEGYHMYSITQKAGGPIATKITLESSSQYSASGPFVALTQPEIKNDGAFKGIPVEEHRGKVIWTAPIKFAPGVNPALIIIKGNVSYQICSERTCQEPTETSFTARFVKDTTAVITPADANAIPAPTISDPKGQLPEETTSNASEPPAVTPKPVANYSTQQLFYLSLMAFLGGLVLNVMPCVLPVISLKLMAFIEQAGESRVRVFILNLWYVAGLMAVFVFLALLSTYGASIFTGKLNSDNGMGWGEMYSYTWVQIIMCSFIFVMALSMLGVWEIPIPGFLGSGAINFVQQKEGPVGAFTKGIFTTLMAVPCTGPFIGPILGLTMGAPLSFTMLIFCMIGLGMGFPYILVGMFPELLSFLPKPGAWMVTVREVMGFFLLGTTVYFFRMVPSNQMVPLLTQLFSLWFICWIVNKIPYGATFGQRLLNWSIGILVATIATGWMFHAYTMENGFPWSETFYSDSSSTDGNPLLSAAQRERQAGRTVMIEFTASWCPNCKANLYMSIETDEVEQFIRKNNVCAIIGDWSRKPKDKKAPDVIKQALNSFGRQSIPMLAILPADGRPPILLDGPFTKGQLLKALSDAQSNPGGKQVNEDVIGAYEGIE